MKKLKVLLTGGSGMVGRNFLEHKKINELEVLAPRRSELDLCEFAAVQAYLLANKPDIVLHAAGKVGGIQVNMSNPIDFLLSNLDMGRNIVWASKLAGIKRLVNLGSSCMYPRNQSEKMKEDKILTGELEPSNEGYALAKIVTARLCEYIMRSDKSYHYKTLIPCNIYGRYDKFKPENSHLLPAIIRKIHQAKEYKHDLVEVWGDGTARREFMYAGDLSDALMRAIINFDSLPSYMNVGLGFDHTIVEYYKAVAKVIGYFGEFTYDNSKPVGMARKLVSIERQTKWGWTAQEELHNGILKTYHYFLKECENDH